MALYWYKVDQVNLIEFLKMKKKLKILISMMIVKICKTMKILKAFLQTLYQKKNELMQKNDLNSSNQILVKSKLNTSVASQNKEKVNKFGASEINPNNSMQKSNTQVNKSSSKLNIEESQISEIPRDSDELSKRSRIIGTLNYLNY